MSCNKWEFVIIKHMMSQGFKNKIIVFFMTRPTHAGNYVNAAEHKYS